MTRNVLGGPLELCGTHPMTGWTRSGCCETGPEDTGSHTVCAVVDDRFLSYSATRTPQPQQNIKRQRASSCLPA